MAYFIDYNAVLDTHANLGDIANKIESDILEIDGYVKQLEGVLDHNTKASYDEQHSKWVADISTVKNLITQYKALVGNVHDLYLQGDQTARRISESIY